MKKLSYIVIILSFFGHNSSGQIIKEHIILFTDRGLYITGENILFSAVLSPKSESSILYCEIITSNGNAVARGKFIINNSNSSGSLAIPSDIVTGNYFFRAYTKMMRKYGASSFSYRQVAVINPYLNEILSPVTIDEANYTKDTLQSDEEDLLKIIPDKKLAGAGDSIHVSLYNIPPEHSYRSFSVSVVPDSLPEYSRVLLSDFGFEGQDFPPEINGPAVTGMVREKNVGKPVGNVMVNLSIMGQGRDFIATRTDTAGRFSFSLRGYSGYHDLFLCTEKENADQEIVIDNDFFSMPITIEPCPFSLTKAERRTVYRMALNVQVDSLFHIKDVDTTKADGIEDAYFYGTPDETIVNDNYVQLPTIEDYLYELPTLVKVRKIDGYKYFRILGDQEDLSAFQPLIMIDLVALNDPDKILGINPQDIDRIEVVNSFYVKGDQIYGGIVNFISRHGDFAGIDLPSSGVFVRYGFPTDNTNGIKDTVQHLQPDARNTVLWIPHLSLNDRSAFSFTAPATPGKYLITVKGITSDGIKFSTSESFDVR